jgi:predicted dehydrogenase
MSRRSSRRQFLQTAAAAGVGFWVAGGVAPARFEKGDKIRIAAIGVGGKGDSDSEQAGNVGDLVAICDTDDKFLNAKAAKFPKAKKYIDYRDMLSEMEKSIDAVVVSGPDHIHAHASLSAMKLGKHVYCQKPLTHDVFEARQMREAAKKFGVCTQMGNQGTAATGFRQGVEIVQAGLIGKVSEVHVWTDRPREYWKQAPDIVGRLKAAPPPKNLHWDLWLNTAPERPHAVDDKGNSAYHRLIWRGYWDFGTGALGDMACHTANLPFMALKLGHPTSIVATTSELNDETYPAWGHIIFQFPQRGDLPPVTLNWYEGRKTPTNYMRPPEELQAKVLKTGEKLQNSGSIMVGDKGILYSPDDYGADHRLFPEKDFKDFKLPEPTLARNKDGGDQGQKNEWAQAIKAGKSQLALSNFDYAGMLAEMVLLGNVAVRAGKKLEFDGPNLKFTNDDSANKLLRRTYRKGWELPV